MHVLLQESAGLVDDIITLGLAQLIEYLLVGDLLRASEVRLGG